MARPKRTAVTVVQTSAIQTRTAEVKKVTEVKSTVEVETAGDIKRADEPMVKEAVKETVKPEIKKSIVVELDDGQVATKDVLTRAEKAYTETHLGTVIKSMELYIPLGQSVAYYVVNGKGSDDFKIGLQGKKWPYINRVVSYLTLSGDSVF